MDNHLRSLNVSSPPLAMMQPLDTTATPSPETMPSESPRPEMYPVSPSPVEPTDPMPENGGQDIWLHSPQNQRHHAQTILWGAMFISAVCHGLFLLLPLPADQSPTQPSVATKTVRVTTLPKKPTSELAVLAQTTLPIVVPKNVMPSPKLENLPRKSPVVNPQNKPVTNPPPSPISPRKQTVSPPQKKTSVTPPQSVTPPPKTEDETPPPVVDPWADFPHYPDAKSGCLDLASCAETEDDLYKVSGFFETELTAKKYDFQAIATETEEKIYRISRDQRTEFLHLFLTPKSGTGYILAKDTLDLEKLKQAAADGLVEESGDATNIAVDCSQFAEPDLFCENDVKKAEIDTFEWVPDAELDKLFDEMYRGFFSNNAYEITEDQTYGDGVVYVMTKGEEQVYMNIVPNKENTGAIIVNWNTLPSTNTP